MVRDNLKIAVHFSTGNLRSLLKLKKYSPDKQMCLVGLVVVVGLVGFNSACYKIRILEDGTLKYEIVGIKWCH